MIDMLIILLVLSFSGIFLLVIYMNHLDKRIYELEKKIDTLQYQTDDVLHDIDVVNKNISNYYVSLRRTEYEKIDAEPNLERFWHNPREEPKIDEVVVLYDSYWNFVTVLYNGYVTWNNIVLSHKATMWAYRDDLLPKV